MLKKIVLTIAALIALTGMSYALSNPDFIENVPGISFKTSTNVKVQYFNDAATSPQKYSIYSKHTSGNRYYGTSSLSTSIFYKEVANSNGTGMTLSDSNLGTLTAGDSLFTGYTPL
jgi:hypothetical protein